MTLMTSRRTGLQIIESRDDEDDNDDPRAQTLKKHETTKERDSSTGIDILALTRGQKVRSCCWGSDCVGSTSTSARSPSSRLSSKKVSRRDFVSVILSHDAVAQLILSAQTGKINNLTSNSFPVAIAVAAMSECLASP